MCMYMDELHSYDSTILRAKEKASSYYIAFLCHQNGLSIIPSVRAHPLYVLSCTEEFYAKTKNAINVRAMAQKKNARGKAYIAENKFLGRAQDNFENIFYGNI